MFGHVSPEARVPSQIAEFKSAEESRRGAVGEGYRQVSIN
jgi:hypothetical protein